MIMMNIMTMKTIKPNRIKNARLDISNKKYYDKKTMLRIVKTKDKLVQIDVLQNIGGKGAYFRLSVDNVIKITEKRLLNRALKMKITKSFYRQLLDYAKDHKDETTH